MNPNFKRIIGLLLAAILLFGMAPVSAVPAQADPVASNVIGPLTMEEPEVDFGESDPSADLESEADFLASLGGLQLSGPYNERLLAVAETQLGYAESERNFLVRENEQTGKKEKAGYTRYGAWYGRGFEYESWCAMFISFCLRYAEVPVELMPRDSGVITWMHTLQTMGLYRARGEYLPKPGDLVFFDWEGDGKGDHVGIVSSLFLQDGVECIETVEGNHTTAVERFTYSCQDLSVMGYGVMTDAEPEEPSPADFVFPQATVYLRDILSSLGISVANNSSLRVDSSLITLSDTVVKRKNLDSITLTASGYFDLATLTITKNKNNVQTVTLSYPDPAGSSATAPEEEEADLVERTTPDDAVWADDILYLTGHLPGNAVVDVVPVSVSVDGKPAAAAYDVKIYTNANQRAKGKTWQPADRKVQVHFRDDAFGDGTKLIVYHLPTADSAPEYVATVTSHDSWVEFEADSFSVYAFTVLEKNISIDGQTYKVTVSYDETAGLPSDAELEVSELSADDASYRSYLDQTAAALGVTAGELGYMRLLDIAIVGADGTAYQPNDKVSVTVELVDDTETGDLRVVHFGSTAEELSAATSGGSVTFRTDGFSLFSFVDLSLIQNVVDAVFGSTYAEKIYENDDIIISGSMPRTAIVEANPASVKIEGEEVLVAYDIKIYAGLITRALGIPWQPTAGSLVVQLKSDALAIEHADIYHMADETADAEIIAENVAVEENTVRFDASSFSVYVVIDHEGGNVVTPRVEFHFLAPLSAEAEQGTMSGTVYQYTAEPYSFLNQGTLDSNDNRTDDEYQHSQILKNGETLERIQNPANKTNPDRYFYGWYIVNPVNVSGSAVTYTWTEDPEQLPFDDSAISIEPSTGLQIGDTVSWSIGSASGSGALDDDGNAHVYVAPIYEDYYFVNFHLGPKEEVGTDEYPGIARSLMTRRLIVLGSDGKAEIRIGNIQAESPDPVHKIFVGWETVRSESGNLVTDSEYITLDSSKNEINNPPDKTGYYITADKEEDIDLYPVFAEARWIYFNTGKAGNGATYVGAQYLLTSDEMEAEDNTYYLETLPVSERNGYEFKGWYLAKDEDENGTGTCITYLNTLDSSNKTIGLIENHIQYDTNGTTKLWEIKDHKLYLYKKMEDVTFYAKWEEVANTSYSVIVWKQKVTDEVGWITQQEYDAQVNALEGQGKTADEIAAAMADVHVKTYDYVSADSQLDIPGYSGRTLQNLINEGALGSFITEGSNNKYTGFSYSYSDMTTETVAGDKSTVINVYYDRDVHTVTFRANDYTYTQTTSNNGTQYGYIEGLGYVQLIRSGSSPYTWSYETGEYVNEYVEINNNTGTQYALIDGEYVQLTLYNNNWYYRIGTTSDVTSTNGQYYYRYNEGGIFSSPSFEQIYYRNGSWRRSNSNYGVQYTGDIYQRWTGKRYAFTQTPVTIAYTDTRYTRSNSQSMQNVYTITALYGQNISEYFSEGTNPLGTTYLGAIWQDVSTPVYYTQILSSIGAMPEQNIIFNYYGSNTSKAVHYYIESLDQATAADGVNRRSFAINGNSVLFDLLKTVRLSYNFLTYDEEYHEIDGYERNDSYSEPYTFYTSGGLHRTQSMADDNYLYYVRVRKSLTFDVNYPNLAGLDFSEGTSENLTVSNIPYGQSLSQYGQINGNWYFGTGDNPQNRLYGPAYYTFEGWYEDPAGTVEFNFDQTMPSGDKIVYAKWTPVNFRVHINPNGAVIDHSNQSAWGGGSQHYTDKATYINADYGVSLTEYTLNRNYVPISDTAAESMSADDVYYYMYAQYFENTGRGLPADLRNAIYLKESQLQDYYDYYVTTITALQATDPGRYNEVTILGYNAWLNEYVSAQKYRRTYSNENYVFLGWFKDDDTMPYNFSAPVEGSFTLTAHWRLDGGYYIQYIPEYRMSNGVMINGDMEQWRDPVNDATYADQATTLTMQQPTGMTADGHPVENGEYIFRGWRIVDVKETLDGSGNVVGVTYTPVEKDEQGNVIYHTESEEFTIEAKYADANGRISLQAVYEAMEVAVHRPEVANLTLDANTGFITADGTSPLAVSQNLNQLGDVGTVVLDVDEGNEQIVFGDIQSNIAVHLKDYAVDPNYFKHPDGLLLLGFDKKQDALSITKLDAQTGADTGVAQPYVPNYPVDGVIAVQRTDEETLYAIWEPMVYLDIVNNTGSGPVTFSLEDANNGALYVVNVRDGTYNRTPLGNLSSITLEDDERIMLAIPQGAEKEISIKGTNTLGTGKVLVWNTSVTLEEDGQIYDTAGDNPRYSYTHTAGTSHSHELAHGESNNTRPFSFNETLIVNENPLTVTFTSKDNAYALLLDDNYPVASGLTGSISERDYTREQVLTASAPVGAKSDTVPSANTCLGYTFKGWAYTADATEPVYKTGNWQISNLEEFFEVNRTPTYTTVTEGGTVVRTLYAVWEINNANNTVYVYKDVPEPGNQNQNFIFDVAINATYKKNSNYYDLSKSGSFTLKHNQYAVLCSSQSTTSPVNITVKVTLYNTIDDTRVNPGNNPDYTFTATTNASAGGSFNSINISVTEQNAGNYTTTMKRLAQSGDTLTLAGSQISTDPLTVEGNKISWTRTEQEGTVIYTNTRQTADVTVKKTLIGENAGTFRYTGNYTADERTITLEPFTVDAGSSVTLPDIPVGAEITLTEEISTDYDVETTFENSSADSNSAANAVTFTVPVNGETVTFKNTLKSYPVKIIKVDQAGNGGVESRFNLTRGAAAIVSGKYTTPSNNVVFDDYLYVGTYTLTETWVQNGYIGLPEPVTLTLSSSSDGTLTSDNPHAVVSGDAANGFVVTVYNQATVNVKITKVLNDPLVANREFTFNINYSYTLNGVQISETPPDPVISGGDSTTVSVPVGATLTVTEANTYNAYVIYETGTAMVDSDDASVADTDNDLHKFTAVINKAGTLTFTNTRKTVNITVRKEVEGGDSTGTEFAFTAMLTNDGMTINQHWSPKEGYWTDSVGHIYPGNESDYNVSHTSSFYLKHNEQIVLSIPYGSRLWIEENNNGQWTTSIGSNNVGVTAANSITLGAADTVKDLTVTFTNTAVLVAPTGITTRKTPYIWMLGLGVLLAIPTVSRRRRRRGEADD